MVAEGLGFGISGEALVAETIRWMSTRAAGSLGLPPSWSGISLRPPKTVNAPPDREDRHTKLTHFHERPPCVGSMPAVRRVWGCGARRGAVRHGMRLTGRAGGRGAPTPRSEPLLTAEAGGVTLPWYLEPRSEGCAMDVIEEIKSRLAKYSAARYTTSSSSITTLPQDASGFQVGLCVRGQKFVVSFDGWHEEFADAEEALNCFACGLEYATLKQYKNLKRIFLFIWN